MHIYDTYAVLTSKYSKKKHFLRYKPTIFLNKNPIHQNQLWEKAHNRFVTFYRSIKTNK